MSVRKILEIENVSRTAAIWGSAAAAIIFGIGFATDTQLLSSFYAFRVQGLTKTIVFPYFGLLTVIFGSYLLAGKRAWELSGSVLAIIAVFALYAWCLVSHKFYPGPYLVALALPAILHIFAVSIHRASEVSEPESRKPESRNIDEQIVEPELAVA